MKQLLIHIKGDKALWAIIILFALVSFLPIYSASTNLIYVVGKGNSWDHLRAHFFHIALGLSFLFIFHRIPYQYYKKFSKIILWAILGLLFFTFISGSQLSGTDSNRWINIPLVNISLQPSLLAITGLMIYISAYLSNTYDEKPTFEQSFWALWLRIGIAFLLIIRANLSTALVLAASTLFLCFLGGHPWRNIFKVAGIGAIVLVFFFLVAKAFPDAMPHRIDTWMSRIESYSGGGDPDDVYQIEHAKMAIATGGVFGNGAGKSVMKNFLPQSSSDFIYAIIVEEYGAFGAIGVLLLYMLLLFRVMVITHKAETAFSKLLVVGMALPIILQAIINMGVAVGLLPVTGQNLPFLSHAGTSILSTCIALGIILSVSANREVQEDFDIEEDLLEEEIIETESEAVVS